MEPWEEWGGPVETGASQSGRPRSGLTAGGVSTDALGVREAALGFDPFGSVASGIASVADTFAGGPAKREREAEAKRDEARAEHGQVLALAEARAYELELARLGATGGGGALAALSAPSPIGGLSWGVVIGGAAVLALVVVLASK